MYILEWYFFSEMVRILLEIILAGIYLYHEALPPKLSRPLDLHCPTRNIPKVSWNNYKEMLGELWGPLSKKK